MTVYYGYEYAYSLSGESSSGSASGTSILSWPRTSSYNGAGLFNSKEAAQTWFVNNRVQAVSYTSSYIVSITGVGPITVYTPDISPHTMIPDSPVMYQFAFTDQRKYPDGSYGPAVNRTAYIAYSPQRSTSTAPPAPSTVTLQLYRDNTAGLYKSDPATPEILFKYNEGVKVIRATFATTRTAVIEETLDGGFMVYEEVASAAVTPVYIYSGLRRLVAVIDAAYIDQYRAV